MAIEINENLKSALKPLYRDLLEHVSNRNDAKSSFCVQWGKNYPTESHSGILFVGKATNGWVDKNDTEPKTVERIFDDKENPVFNRDDQMEWVEKLKGNKGGYNTRRSAFWRVIEYITKYFYKDDWWSHVAWSNLYKISPKEGNPDGDLIRAQFGDCVKILKKEVEILSPEIVVFLTGMTWGYDFLKHYNDGEDPEETCDKEKWGNVYKIDDIIFIISPHPQGKPKEQRECLIKLISRYMK